MATHAAEQYIRTYDPLSRGGKVRWYCMDDRPAITSFRYRQTAGGAVGVGEDLGVALKMKDPEALLAQHLPAAHVLGSVAAAELKPKRIILGTHEGCAAEGAAETIRDAIVNQRANVYDQTLKVKPGITVKRFDTVADAFSQLQIEDPCETGPMLDEGLIRTAWTPTGINARAEKLPAVPRVSLYNSPHIASNVLVNYREKTTLDSEEAFFAQTPAYHISMGDQTELARGLQEVGFEFDEADFIDASAVRHAATTLFLPKPHGNPLGIHLVEAI